MAKSALERIDLDPFAKALKRVVDEDGGPQVVAVKIGIKYSTLISYVNGKSLPSYPMVLLLKNHYPEVICTLDSSVMTWLKREIVRENALIRQVLGQTA
jgi:hypothetical protein